MIAITLYLAPLPRGWALVATERAVDRLRAGGYLLATAPQPVQVHVLSPWDRLPADGWPVAPELAAGAGYLERHVVDFLRRAAVAATAAGAGVALGPRGRWYATLVAWGWLLLLSAGQSWAQVVGGLWLAAGLPALRRSHARWRSRWASRAAEGLRSAVEGASVTLAHHAGLTQLAEAMSLPDVPDEEKCRTAAARCAALGVPDLAELYVSLAAGRAPRSLWVALERVGGPAPASAERAAEAPPVATAGGAAAAAAAGATVETAPPAP